MRYHRIYLVFVPIGLLNMFMQIPNWSAVVAWAVATLAWVAVFVTARAGDVWRELYHEAVGPAVSAKSDVWVNKAGQVRVRG
jgi:hypothetical protein